MWNGPLRWLRVLDYTEGAVAGDLPVRQFGGQQGTGNISFETPKGICVDKDRVYVADFYNHRVQVLTKEGVHVRNFGVLGQLGFDNEHLHCPTGVWVEPGLEGHVYVADHANYRIQVFAKNGTFVRSIGAHGQGNDQFNEPLGVVTDEDHLYVADSQNARVQVLTKRGEYVRTLDGITGTFGGGDNTLACPSGVTVDNGNVYIADTGNNRVKVLTKQGVLVRIPFSQELPDRAWNNGVRNMAVEAGPTGRLYVSDGENKEIKVLAKNGENVRIIGGGRGRLGCPSDVAVEHGPDGLVYVTDSIKHRVVVFLK